MNQNWWLQILKREKAIAVIRSPEMQLGISMAQAMAEGGMRLIEITWNSHQPAELIKQLRTQLPNCFIGAGTILTKNDLEKALIAGAQFIFSPHVNQELIEAAIVAKTPIIPGALTPTEIVTAWQAGASCVKVFPIQTVGGVNYLKNLQAPLGHIPVIPTGGVTIENAKDYLQTGAIAVGLASELFPLSLIQTRDWQAIALRAKLLQERTKN